MKCFLFKQLQRSAQPALSACASNELGERNRRFVHGERRRRALDRRLRQDSATSRSTFQVLLVTKCTYSSLLICLFISERKDTKHCKVTY